MRNKVSKNLLLTILLVVFVIAFLGVSFAYTTTYNSVSTGDNITINHISESGNAIVFSVTRTDANPDDTEGLKIKVKVTEVSDSINSSQLRANVKCGSSVDDISFDLNGNNLVVGSDTQILNISPVSNTMYFSVTFYDNDTLLNIDEDNF